jgi:DNA-binding response OmpR family regulator
MAMHGTKPPLEQTRVLVVDDDVDSREALRALLLQAGMAVGIAQSGSEALKLADDFTPAVVITALSGQDTLDLARQIRRQKSIGHRVSFIALTTLPDAEFRAKALSAGFDVCLVKPVPPGALLSAIAQTPR